MEEKDSELTTEYNGGLSEDVAVIEPSPDTAEATSYVEKSPAEESESVQAEQAEDENAVEEPHVVAPPKKKRGARIFWNIFLVVVVAAGILAMFGIVREIDPSSGISLGEVLKSASPLFIGVLIIAVLAGMALDVSKFCLISKTVTGKVHFAASAKVNFIGRYYDAVTPFSTGGQPMQIYYLSTKGVSGGNASAMVMIRYFS
ncbi:MAG: lysylphosphatidylglycerol synthase domain-containing protein, partial [Clostridia bacterium]|nr:lysylphosphatidylglycerol synthase domain-containing protein [Clostridia bacterium]